MWKNRSGFTLVEVLVGSAIFIVIALSAYRAFAVLMQAVNVSQAKLSATAIANEKFEIIRNLPFADVGILGGLPVGKIQRNETVLRDGYSFNLETSIRSVDDPFDGTIGGNPSDTSPADYRLADLNIVCSNCAVFSPINFTTLVAPHSLETASTNGALFIQVFDASGIPIPNASVHIVNMETNPDTIIDETTDSTGFLRIVDAPPGINAYNITATKSGYTSDQTYLPGGAAGAEPIKLDSTVVVQQVTQISLSIDRVSSLNVSTLDSSCTPLPSINFSLTGTKLIGAPDVLKYPAQDFTTDATGIYAFPSLEWDTYSMLLAPTAHQLVGTTLPLTFSINPNESLDMQVILASPSEPTLLVSVVDQLSDPINDATVQLEKIEFDETKITNSGTCALPGKVFWNGLANDTYTLTVSKTGYQTSVSTINISSNWENQNIVLTP